MCNFKIGAAPGFRNNGAAADFGNAIARQPRGGSGDASGGLAGSSAAQPLKTPTEIKPIPTPAPAAPSTNPLGQLGQQAGGPQGFAGLMGAMPGLTQAIGNVGGMPALMAIYEKLRGAQGGSLGALFNKAGMTKRAGGGDADWLKPHAPVAPAAPAAPAPAARTGGGDADWLKPHPPAPAAFNAGGAMDWLKTHAPGRAPARPAAAPAAPAPAARTGGGDADWLKPYTPPPTPTPVPTPEPAPSPAVQGAIQGARIPGDALLHDIGATAARRAAHAGIGPAFKLVKPLATKGGLIAETGINAGLEVADFAGIRPTWLGGHKTRDEIMPAFDRDTTPDDMTMFGQTGSPWLDKPLGYLGAAFNAHSNPLKSFYRAGKFQFHDMNPLRDVPGVSNDVNWRTGTGQARSIPGTHAHNFRLDPSNPAWGAAGAAEQAAQFRRENRFHRMYNPAGTVQSRNDGPGAPPSARRWATQPIEQTRNFTAMAKARGLLPTLRTAWLPD